MTQATPPIDWKLIEDGGAFTRTTPTPKTKKSWLRRIGAWLVRNA